MYAGICKGVYGCCQLFFLMALISGSLLGQVCSNMYACALDMICSYIGTSIVSDWTCPMPYAQCCQGCCFFIQPLVSLAMLACLRQEVPVQLHAAHDLYRQWPNVCIIAAESLPSVWTMHLARCIHASSGPAPRACRCKRCNAGHCIQSERMVRKRGPAAVAGHNVP